MKISRHIGVTLLCLLLLTGCTKSAKSPPIFKSLPAGAQILFQLDFKALVATYANVLKAAADLVPDKEMADIPSWEEVVAKVKEPTGIDLNQIGLVVMASYLDVQSGSEQRMALIAEGLRAEDLVGSQSGEHNGKPLYQLKEEKKLHYAQLDDKHVAAAESQESLQLILETHAGKGQGLTGNPMLSRLQKIDPAFNQMRVYLLTGDFPGLEKSPVKVNGGGFFVDLQKGFSAAIIGEEDGLSKLKLMGEMGLMQVKNQMTEGMKKAPPEEIKKMGPAMEAAKAFIEGIQFKHDGELLSVSYQGDQPPAVIIGIMAAVAIPAFIDYTRKSKLSEIHMNLDRCYRGVLDYYGRSNAQKDGTILPPSLPASMSKPICPGDRTIETLDGNSRLFDPALFAKETVFGQIGLEITDKSYGCYQLEVDSKAPGFACHAWTDLDGDGQPAHWKKEGVYRKETDSFQAGHVWHDPASDNW